MATSVNRRNPDFKKSQLGYKIGDSLQLLSSQGGVFSYSHKLFDFDKKEFPDPPAEKLQFNGKSIPARIIGCNFLEIFDDDLTDDDGKRGEFDHENEILKHLAEAINGVFIYDINENKCLILMVDVDSCETGKLPSPGSQLELFDMNQQSVFPILAGTIFSKRPNGTICLMALSQEQSRYPTISE